MKKCPLLNKKCIESECMFWCHLIGTNPQTGSPLDEFNCAISWLPLLLIENANTVRHTQAAIEDFRNKSSIFQDMFMGAVNQAKQLQEDKKKQLPKADFIDVSDES